MIMIKLLVAFAFGVAVGGLGMFFYHVRWDSKSVFIYELI